MDVNGHRLNSVHGRHWQIVLLTAAGVIGLNSPAEAAIYYWQDSGPGFWQSAPAQPAPPRRQKVRRHPDKKIETSEKESAKPQGPLIISISIAQQKMRVYDANGLFAESPVSTGMPGHPTPMGVFSVIQKHKFHHSNIYSGAPMPFMQRITWSGVAMHAGVLPGYPASHGCIRMPAAFAVKMWNWTRMGARVVITPGEVTPASFSHPLLAATKVPPQPVIPEGPKAEAPAAESVGPVAAAVTIAKIAETKVEPRSTVGHDDSEKPATEETHPSTTQTRTADARDTLPPTRPSMTMSDAAPDRTSVPSSADKKIAEQVDDSSKSEAGSEAGKPQADPHTARQDEVKPTESKSDHTGVEIKPGRTDEPKPSGMEAGKSGTGPVTAAEPKKDPTRPAETAKSVVPKIDVPAAARGAQISVFVSRKDSKLYVRQNFSPLFDTPVTISPDERPLGTHIFTAQVDKDDANVLHWSVVSLPAQTKRADQRGDDARASRRSKVSRSAPVEVKASPEQDSPAEALDRLKLPADVMTRIVEALSTGASIIVSDQAIAAGETGEGTDFIVRLR